MFKIRTQGSQRRHCHCSGDGRQKGSKDSNISPTLEEEVPVIDLDEKRS